MFRIIPAYCMHPTSHVLRVALFSMKNTSRGTRPSCPYLFVLRKRLRCSRELNLLRGTIPLLTSSKVVSAVLEGLDVNEQLDQVYCAHTSYLSFFLHEQNFWRIKFTPKKRVNYGKIHSKLPIFCVITAKYTVNCQIFALNLKKLHRPKKIYMSLARGLVTNMRYARECLIMLRLSKKRPKKYALKLLFFRHPAVFSFWVPKTAGYI